VRALALHRDGVVASHGFPETVGIVRYRSDGSFDAGFGTNGVYAEFPGEGANTIGLAVDERDRVLLLAAIAPYPYRYVLMRVDAGGVKDPTLGLDGLVSAAVWPEARLGLALQPDGRIVLTGSGVSIDGRPVAVVERRQSNGDPDASFGTGGRVEIRFDRAGESGSASFREAVLTSAGQAVVAGTLRYDAPGTATASPVLCKLTAAGELEPTFGENGCIVLSSFVWRLP
jgi:uncharacterized delta-60 repeat protein